MRGLPFLAEGTLRQHHAMAPKPGLPHTAGFACTLGCWAPQLDELLARDACGRPATRVLLMDNRGVGRSSIPRRRAAYSTSHMASDVLAVLVRSRRRAPACHHPH